MNAILLSAGFGTRFRPYTQRLAKPAIPFFNLAFIGYSLYYAQKFSCQNVIINTHHLPQTIKDAVLNIKQKLNLNIQFINESPEILDGGGAIKNAQTHLQSSDHFLAINTDAPHIFPDLNYKNFLEKHIQSKALCTFLTIPKPNAEADSSGIWTSKNSFEVSHIGLSKDTSSEFNQFIGVMILSKRIFNYFNEKNKFNLLYDILLPLIQENKEKIHSYSLKNYNWIETGNLKGYLYANKFYLNKLIDEPQSPISNELIDILSFFDLKPQLYSSDKCKVLTLNPSHLNQSSQFKGHIILDKNTQLNKKTTITNSVLYNQKNIVENINDTLLIT